MRWLHWNFARNVLRRIADNIHRNARQRKARHEETSGPTQEKQRECQHPLGPGGMGGGWKGGGGRRSTRVLHRAAGRARMAQGERVFEMIDEPGMPPHA
jgi:hypothetical protein